MFKISLAAARVNAELSMKDAAKALGISYSKLRQYELYESCPTESLFESMCNLYQISAEYVKVVKIEPDKVPRSNSRLYRIWAGMKQRCNNPKNTRFSNYGGKGIKVCQEWDASYDSFAKWSAENGYTDDLTIDRIDSSKGYCPDNCRWIPGGLNSSLAMSEKYGRTEAWSFEHWNDQHPDKK